MMTTGRVGTITLFTAGKFVLSRLSLAFLCLCLFAPRICFEDGIFPLRPYSLSLHFHTRNRPFGAKGYNSFRSGGLPTQAGYGGFTTVDPAPIPKGNRGNCVHVLRVSVMWPFSSKLDRGAPHTKKEIELTEEERKEKCKQRLFCGPLLSSILNPGT